ncbi:MAG: hypothetical protein HOP19_04960 [Acidobacteria bacterium]|nr:hypothetical protein [Acidobacteriota bacterium]
MKLRKLLLGGAILGCLTLDTFAQTITARVTGTVSDLTSAVVPNANVTATTIGTGHFVKEHAALPQK